MYALTAENLRQEVLKLWSSEQRSIKSVLMVTHNIEEAVEMADRVVVLGSHPGHLIADVRVRSCSARATVTVSNSRRWWTDCTRF